MVFLKASFIVCLSVVFYFAFYAISANFLQVVLVVHSVLPWLPFQRYDELTPNLSAVTTPQEKLLKEYDFIVVGAGSAGAVVANRLSENKEWKVLLVEAGGGENMASEVPSFFFATLLTDLNWNYHTEPDSDVKTHSNANNRAHSWPRGKALGGSSAINAMLYVRGNAKDYDRWRDLGNEGWSYQDVLPYFMKSEDNRNIKFANGSYHGTGGYLTVEDFPHYPLSNEIMKSCVHVAPFNEDINGAVQTGCHYFQGTTRKGSRCSTGKAFIKPAVKRENLHVSAFSHVHKVNVNPGTMKTESVVFKREGKMFNIRVSKEVVLSAGTIGSAQLLMLSGIGPENELKKHEISVLRNLPVGKNLQDHVWHMLNFVFNDSVTLQVADITKFETSFKYFYEGGGYLSTSVNIGAFIQTSSVKEIDWPDIQLIYLPHHLNTPGTVYREGLDQNETLWNDYFKNLAGKHGFSMAVTLLRPNSMGAITLRSTNPYDHPIIRPNYFHDEADLQSLREGVKLAKKASLSLTKFNTSFYDEVYFHCKEFDKESDEYLDCAIKSNAFTMYHPVGTCKMGIDGEAVVDPKLKVVGVNGLRVIDASIMPFVISGNTNAPSIMIGEKGADFIKEDWK